MKHLYIFGTVLFTVYGQLVIKWRMPLHGALPGEMLPKLVFLLNKCYENVYWFGEFGVLEHAVLHFRVVFLRSSFSKPMRSDDFMFLDFLMVLMVMKK